MPMQADSPVRPDVATNSSGVTVAKAVQRGFFGRCPHCGEGRMFRAFLKVADQCPVCGEELHHHRADDFPAYIVILIVGHAIVPIILAVETHIAPAMWISMIVWPAAVIALTFLLLQPVKGAIVGLQWAMDMHGFEHAKRARAGGLAAAANAPEPALPALAALLRTAPAS